MKPITEQEIEFSKRKRYSPYYVTLRPAPIRRYDVIDVSGAKIGQITQAEFNRFRKTYTVGRLCYKNGVLFTDLLEIPKD